MRGRLAVLLTYKKSKQDPRHYPHQVQKLLFVVSVLSRWFFFSCASGEALNPRDFPSIAAPLLELDKPYKNKHRLRVRPQTPATQRSALPQHFSQRSGPRHYSGCGQGWFSRRALTRSVTGHNNSQLEGHLTREEKYFRTSPSSRASGLEVQEL